MYPDRRALLLGIAVVATLAVTVGSSLAPAEAQEGPYLIEGTVLGPDGEPLEGISVRAFSDLGTNTFGPWDSRDTGPDGAFSIEVPDGSYAVQLFRVIGGVECSLGYVDNEIGHTFFFQVNRIVISGKSATGITVRIPDTPSALCRPIAGTLTGSDGEPIGVVSMAADALGPLAGVRANWASNADGTFTLYAQPGSYHVLLATTAGSECTVVPSADPEPTARARIEVGEDGARDLRIVVSGEPSDTLQRFYCSVPPGMVTTELQPGWNLAGWTGDEADTDALLGAIPGLEVAHAWDTAGAYFLSVFRGGPDEVNSLKVLTPGMGVWLYVSGTEPVEWTRTLLPESGFVSLTEGWNLVSWSGADGIAVNSALVALGADLTAAGGWDAEKGRGLHYAPTAPEPDNTLQGLARGGALWVEVSGDRPWLQRGSSRPLVEFVSEIAPHARASVPASIESVLEYFAHRFGVFVPGMRYVIGDHPTVCGGYAQQTIFLEEPCLRAIAHEYAHAIQEHLAGPVSNAGWITEGVANRWSAEYYHETGDRSYDTHLADIVLPNSMLTPIPLEQMESGLFIHDYAGPNYSVAHLAIDWLISLTGEDRLLAYYHKRPSYRTWQEAFAEVFDISVGDFYASFAAHRARVAAPHPTIRGTVMDTDAEPLVDARVRAQARGEGTRGTASTREDGSFAVPVGPGRYVLEVHLEGPNGRQHTGWYGGAGGFTALESEAKIFEMGEVEITGIAIEVPHLQWYQVEGVVLGPNGQGLPRIGLDAFPRGDYAAPGAEAGENGAFSVFVLGGSFDLHLYSDTPVGRRLIGWYGRDSGFSPVAGDRRMIDTQGQDVTGITITFPVDPAPSQWRRIQGVVLGPNGEPQEGIGVDAYPLGDTPGLDATTDETGAFSVWVLPGPFELHLRADTPSGRRRIGSYGEDGGLAAPGNTAGAVEVGDTDVSGITVNLPVAVAMPYWQPFRGVVLDHAGRPREGVLVEGKGEFTFANWSATTGADGRFETVTLPGDYRLSFKGEECFLGWYGKTGALVQEQDDAGLVRAGGPQIGITSGKVCTALLGTVTGANGEPVAGARIHAERQGGGPGSAADTGEDGTFVLQLAEGSYVLQVHLGSPDGRLRAGWYGGDSGFTPVRGEREVVEIGDGEVVVDIRVPELHWYRLAGVVLGPDGEPIEGMGVDAFPVSGYEGPFDHTDENGAFSMLVLGGSFQLHLYGATPEGRRWLGTYGREAGYAPLFEDARTVDIDGQDVTGLSITFPIDPAPSQWRRIQGVVLGPNGEPREGIGVDAYPVGDTPGLDATTDETGAFSVWVLPGPFELHLRADTPSGRLHIGSYGGENGFVPPGVPGDVVEVGDTDVSGIAINLPVDRSASTAE